jgi:septal ring factor EnvC (AmiA/AmiB activator)
MLEWLWRLISALLGRESAAQIAAQAKHNKYADDAREDFATLKDAYNDLMTHYQIMAQELRAEIETLRNEVASVVAQLERERVDHKECRAQLAAMKAELKQLKGRVDVIQEKQSDDNA